MRIPKIISKDGHEYILIQQCNKNMYLYKEMIYGYKEYKNCDVNIIAYDNKSFSAPLIEQMNLTQYHPTNFSEKAKVIENFEHILLLILFIALCAVSLKIWYRLCRKFVADIKENLTENYFWKSLRAIPHKYILLIITALGIPVVLLTIFLLSDFSIFIISKYIPNDNIFDVSYYISVIVDNSNNINSYTSSIYDEYKKYSEKLVKIIKSCDNNERK